MIQALLACALLAAAPNEKATAELRQAISSEKVDDALKAIAAGADVNAFVSGSRVPLMSKAARMTDPKARLAVMKAMLDAGARADADASEYGSPIPAPVRANDLAVVKLLLAHKANPDVPGSLGSTPLLWAIDRGPAYREMVDVLLTAGANPRTKSPEATTNGGTVRARQRER